MITLQVNSDFVTQMDFDSVLLLFRAADARINEFRQSYPLEPEEIMLLRQGQKIPAIKSLRTRYNLGLAVAKNLCDRWLEDNKREEMVRGVEQQSKRMAAADICDRLRALYLSIEREYGV